MTHRAMRNVSSYRQKTGRAGENAAPLFTRLQFYPNVQRITNFIRIITNSLLNQRYCAVAVQNESVLRTQVYMSVFDWIKKNEFNVEEMRHPDWSDMGFSTQVIVWKSGTRLC